MHRPIGAFGCLLLFVFLFFGIGRAEAAPVCTANKVPKCTIQDAYADALSNAQAGYCGSGTVSGTNVTHDSVQKFFRSDYKCTGNNNIQAGYQHWYGPGCPAPSSWDSGSNTCFDPQQCLAKNDALGSAITSTQTSTNGCFGGCAMSMGSTYETRTLTGPSGQQVTIFRGNMRYTGASCTTPTKAPDDKSPECKPVDGMTFCHKDDGQLCGKSSNDRLVCWRPGETGDRTDGPTKQVQQAGPTHTPPNPQMPNGDTLVKSGPTVVSNISGNVPNSPTQNITTNITNYNTTNGTNAGPTNQGENGNGDGGGKEDDGEDDKQNAKLSGGTSCDVPPVCDVVDDAMCKSGIITWKFQCDGAAEVGSAQQEAQLAVDLLNMTWDEEEGQFADGAIQRYNETRAALAQDVIDVGESNDWDLLDSSGFLGGGSCPQIPPLTVGATTIPFDFGPICSLFASLGLLVEALAYFVALRILTAP